MQCGLLDIQKTKIKPSSLYKQLGGKKEFQFNSVYSILKVLKDCKTLHFKNFVEVHVTKQSHLVA